MTLYRCFFVETSFLPLLLSTMILEKANSTWLRLLHESNASASRLRTGTPASPVSTPLSAATYFLHLSLAGEVVRPYPQGGLKSIVVVVIIIIIIGFSISAVQSGTLL